MVLRALAVYGLADFGLVALVLTSASSVVKLVWRVLPFLKSRGWNPLLRMPWICSVCMAGWCGLALLHAPAWFVDWMAVTGAGWPWPN